MGVQMHMTVTSRSGGRERARCQAEACTEEAGLLPPSTRDVLTLVCVGKKKHLYN